MRRPSGSKPGVQVPPSIGGGDSTHHMSLRFRDAGAAGLGGASPSSGQHFDGRGGRGCGTRCMTTDSFPCTPSGNLESCGFVFEQPSCELGGGSAASSSSSRSPRPPRGSGQKGELVTPPGSPRRRLGSQRAAPAAAASSAAAGGGAQQPAERAVLLIEMELMGDPPGDEPREPRKVTLRTWLQEEGRSMSDAADVFGALMLSVRHIHRKRIVHADLKPDNLFCLVERARVTAVRIGDFGLAAENNQFRQASSGVVKSFRITGGTPGYMAPEIMPFSEVCQSEKVDIFACAVILLELLLRPFRTQMERMGVIDKFRNADTPGTVPDFINSRLPKTRLLLREMAEHDPAVRLSAEEVCKRFEKEVRKELSRASMPRCGSPTSEPEPVQPAQVPGKERASAGGGRERGGAGSEKSGGHSRRKGRKAGRGRGG